MKSPQFFSRFLTLPLLAVLIAPSALADDAPVLAYPTSQPLVGMSGFTPFADGRDVQSRASEDPSTVRYAWMVPTLATLAVSQTTGAPAMTLTPYQSGHSGNWGLVIDMRLQTIIDKGTASRFDEVYSNPDLIRYYPIATDSSFTNRNAIFDLGVDLPERPLRILGQPEFVRVVLNPEGLKKLRCTVEAYYDARGTPAAENLNTINLVTGQLNLSYRVINAEAAQVGQREFETYDVPVDILVGDIAKDHLSADQISALDSAVAAYEQAIMTYGEPSNCNGPQFPAYYQLTGD